VPNGYSYFFQAPDELVNFYNAPLSGPVDPITAVSSQAPTLKLVDNDTIVAYSLANPHYITGFLVTGPSVYKRMDSPPRDTLNDDWNDPVLLFKYYTDLWTFQNASINKATGGENYVGKRKDNKIKKQFLGKGYTVKTPIRKIRVTNLTNYAPIGLVNDAWTTVYTGDPETNEGIFANITPGATVKIKGAKGPLSILNGTYYNGVSVLNNGENYTLKDDYVDKGPNGSYNDLFNSFLLNLDSSQLASLADPLTGFIDIPPGVSVCVTYKVHHDTEYPEFCAACAAYYYAAIRASTHNFRRPFTPEGSARIVNSWSELQAGLLAGTVVQLYRDDGDRFGQPTTNLYYHNWYDLNGFTAGTMINCPYPLNYNNPILEYDVALGNYLVNVQNLYFGIMGTLESDQLDPAATFGYPPVIPGPGRAHFVSTIAPANIVNGLNFATPPPGYATMGDFGFDFGNVNSYFFGEINPQLTDGKAIGYLYMSDQQFIDPFDLAIDGMYAPENPNTSSNPRISRESVSTIYSEMMKWFNAAQPYDKTSDGKKRKPCEKIIINLGSGGDPTLMLAIAEFFGADRISHRGFIVPQKSDAELISYQNPAYPTVNNAAADQKFVSEFYYVNLNEQMYPGSVIQGCEKHPREVIILTDIFNASASDIAPNRFIGDNDDGYLGDYVQMSLVGCVDGREFGFSDGFENFPVNDNTTLRLSDGTPVSPFLLAARDYTSFYYAYGKSEVSPYIQHKGIQPVRTPVSGTDGGAALPISFEATLFQDFGLNPMTRPPLDGWTASPPDFADPTTWRFLYLEQAIEHAKERVHLPNKGCKVKKRMKMHDSSSSSCDFSSSSSTSCR
jgi:hypothetical protein